MTTTTPEGRRGSIWLDCDPGHDDAIAMVLAFFGRSSNAPEGVDVLGISTTHGNATGLHTYTNAVKLLAAFGIAPSQCQVWRGADGPLLRKGKEDVDIHGEDGLGGVLALPSLEDRAAREHLDATRKASSSAAHNTQGPPHADPLALVAHQLALLAQRREQGQGSISLIATGPLTNIALLLKLCPNNMELLCQTVSQIVLMGGAAATAGNRSPLAEWNLLVDPEAAAIVFDSPIPVVMAGLNVTHQAIFTPTLHAQFLSCPIEDMHDHQSFQRAVQKSSPPRQLISSALTFFSRTYAESFGFVHGPPIHDMLTIAYVLDSSLFYALEPRQEFPGLTKLQEHGQRRVAPKRFRVDIDTSEGQVAGTTIVDFYRQLPVDDAEERWSKGGRNAVVLEYVDTERLWPLLFDAVHRLEAHKSKTGS